MRLSDLIVRRRWWVLACWAATAVLMLPAARGVERSLDVAARVRGSESAAVDSLVALRFVQPYAHYAVLVVSGTPSPTEVAGRMVLDSVAAAVRRVPGLTRVRSYEDARDTLFVAAGHAATFVLAGIDANGSAPDVVVERLRAATRGLAEGLSGRYPAVGLRWTGQAALNADLRRASAADARDAEQRALPLTLLLLLAAFGTLVAAAIPVISGILVIAFALGTAAAISAAWPLSIMLQSFVSMIGLGLGIDYALLTVSRFRESRAAGRAPHEAARDAGRYAGRTVALSGAAVAIGFVALLTIPLNELRSVAVGGILAAGFAVLASSTLLPALLAILRGAIDWGRLRPAPRAPRSSARWHRWGRLVARHPLAVLAVAGLPLLALASQAPRMTTGQPDADWLPKEEESIQALHELEAMGRTGVLQTVRILVELPEGTTVLDRIGWTAARRLRQHLFASEHTATVNSFTNFERARPPSRLTLLATARELREAYLADDRGTLLLEAIPREGLDPVTVIELVYQWRALDYPSITGLEGVRVRFGGLPALRADFRDAVGGRFWTVVAMVVTGTFLALLVGFRSILVPLKALALNLLSVAASFGAVVLVFQDGHGATLLGLGGPTQVVFAVVPTLVFCTVFGLSMDYEVFLVARVAEARRQGRGETEALTEGLACTAPVITSAAAIMVVVFGAFTLGDFLVMKMLGFALAVAVLLDATVVRIALGPALLAIAGKWNWWPGELVRTPAPLPRPPTETIPDAAS
jgi:RND superfamily putative drug exporter